MDHSFVPIDPALSKLNPYSHTVTNIEDLTEENDYSDAVLKYINQILLEEDLEDENCLFQDSALQAAEKPFCDILSEKHLSVDETTPNQNADSQVNNCTCCCNGFCEHQSSCIIAPPTDHTFQSSSWLYCPRSSFAVNGWLDYPVYTALVPDLFSEGARKFVSHCNQMIFDFQNNIIIPLEVKETTPGIVVEAEKSKMDHPPHTLNEGKYDRQQESGIRMRNSKRLAIYTEESEQSDMFDKVLLSNDVDDESSGFMHHEALQNGSGRMLHHKGQSKRSFGRTTRRRKQPEWVDLRTLLIHCAEAVAVNDYRRANELIMQIRQHSSPLGDGPQRLAHFFANALEARISGSGSDAYAALVAKRILPADMLKAFWLFISVCPFMKMSNFFTTQTVMDLAQKARRLHIIHFGILYGFQWPCLIQRLSTRPGGPPVLHITGIDLLKPGFRSAARVEETGYHLAKYCHKFNVPFEYNGIAKKWESIRFEDFKIDRDEVIVVNSLYQFRYLLDETVALNSPRDTVLNLIRRIKPSVFIHGIINGAYNAPFFMSRFREALFYFSAVFDMFEGIVPQEYQERMVFEREIYGKEILNVIACEGSNRVERTETYKQWQLRNLRAGFRKLPLNQEIMKKVRTQVMLHYHKDFLVDENNEWMLQGWKGRILFALSCWKPA